MNAAQIVAKTPYFDWEEDEACHQLYVRAIPIFSGDFAYNDIVSFPVNEVGYNQLRELENVLGQMAMYIKDRLDFERKIVYNPEYDVNKLHEHNNEIH